MAKEQMRDQQVKQVSGGLVDSRGDGEVEQTMKWCENCQDTTPHDENGNCLICNMSMPGARYRF